MHKGFDSLAAQAQTVLGKDPAAVAVNELFMPADVAQTSPGMVAFDDMILFVLVAGLLSLAPTWFLLKLFVENAPRALLATELLIAAMGAVSWLAMTALAVATPEGGPSSLPNWPQAARELLGLLIAFGAIPRMVFGPVLQVIEGRPHSPACAAATAWRGGRPWSSRNCSGRACGNVAARAGSHRLNSPRRPTYPWK